MTAMTGGHETDKTVPPTRGYMHLVIGTANLLVPLTQIISLESVLDIRPDRTRPGQVGQIRVGEVRWPVYNLDEDLQLLDDLSPARKVCVCLGKDTEGYGIACDQVNNLKDEEAKLVALPLCMKTGLSPIEALAIRDKQVMCVTDFEALGKLFDHLQEIC